jgi:hypothetical protein
MSLPRLGAARPRIRRLRARAATTPGRLRLVMVASVLAALLAGIALAAETAVRRDAADAVTTRDEPLLVAADQLYASLSDADATAATTFLRGGIEPAGLRARYLADLRRSTAQLAALGRRVQGSSEAAAVAAIGANVPVYTGLIETARANNRQGFPVGAAYLRQASSLMRGTILPAAARLYAAQAQHLSDHERTGTRAAGAVLALLVCLAALAVLVVSQVFVARRTHRVFNVPLVAATVVLLALIVWAAFALTSARRSLVKAQRDGSDAVQVLSAARIVRLRAQADESLALVARGGGDVNLADFAIADRLLSPPGGLLGEASRVTRRTGTNVDDLAATWRGIRAEHARIVRLEDAANFPAAIRLAVGNRSREAALGDRMNRRFGALIAAGQERFEEAASDARSRLDVLVVGIPLLIVVAAGLAVLGLQTRINEYR